MTHRVSTRPVVAGFGSRFRRFEASHLIIATMAVLVIFPFSARRLHADDVCYVVADNAHGDGVDAEGGADALARVDPHSGSETIIGKTGTEKIEAIDFDPATGMLYGANGDQLGTIDLATGAFKALDHKFGRGKGELGELAFNDVDGLAFDPSEGLLYGSVRKNGPDLLIIINHKAGKATGDAFGSGVDYVLIDPINRPPFSM